MCFMGHLKQVLPVVDRVCVHPIYYREAGGALPGIAALPAEGMRMIFPPQAV